MEEFVQRLEGSVGGSLVESFWRWWCSCWEADKRPLPVDVAEDVEAC